MAVRWLRGHQKWTVTGQKAVMKSSPNKNQTPTKNKPTKTKQTKNTNTKQNRRTKVWQVPVRGLIHARDDSIVSSVPETPGHPRSSAPADHWPCDNATRQLHQLSCILDLSELWSQSSTEALLLPPRTEKGSNTSSEEHYANLPDPTCEDVLQEVDGPQRHPLLGDSEWGFHHLFLGTWMWWSSSFGWSGKLGEPQSVDSLSSDCVSFHCCSCKGGSGTLLW